MARCVALLNMADGARDILTPPISAQRNTKVRTAWSTTPPNTAHERPKDQTPTLPHGSEHTGSEARPACSPTTAHKSTRARPPSTSHQSPKPRSAWATPPSSPRKCEKVRQSSSMHKNTKPRTASTSPSSEPESDKVDKRNALSHASNYSDVTEISVSGPRSSKVDEVIEIMVTERKTYKHRVSLSKKSKRQTCDFVASSQSSVSDPRTPYGLPYEDYPIDDDELDGISLLYDEPRYPQKSLGSYLEAKVELHGQNKEENRLGLGWVKTENRTPRAALNLY